MSYTPLVHSKHPTQRRDDLHRDISAIPVTHGGNFDSPPSNDTPLMKLWWFESLAVVVMTLSVMALFLTVGLHQGQPIPKWPISITINSLVSIYGTIFKTCLLLVVAESLAQMKWLWYRRKTPLIFIDRFDAAGRGPLGGLNLIWATRKELRRALLPILGGLIVILALAVDPFLQQIVQSYQCVTTNNTAQATIFTARLYEPLDEGIHPSMAQAAIAGFWNISAGDETVRRLFQCEGNSSCNTSEPYWTLAVCSECSDWTTHLQATCEGDGSRCNYTLPNSGPSPEHEYPFGMYFSMSRDKNNSLDWTSTTQNNTGTVLNTIHTLQLYKNTQPGNIPHDHPQVQPWSAASPEFGVARCHLRPCAQLRSPAVNFTRDRLLEQVLDSVPLGVYDPSFEDTSQHALPAVNAIPVKCLSGSDEMILKRNNFVYSNFSTSYHPPGGQSRCSNGQKTNDADLQRICDACFFSLTDKALEDFQAIFSDADDPDTTSRVASGSNLLSVEITNFEMSYSYANYSINGGIGYNYSQPGNDQFSFNHFWMLGNVTFDSLSSYLSGLADAFTLQIRHDVRESPERYNSTETQQANSSMTAQAYSSVICVSADWRWSILPLTLFVLALILFVGTLVEAHGDVTRSWKSSNLPLLFHGLEVYDRQDGPAPVTAKEMKNVSERLTVRLGAGNNGLAFVSGTSSDSYGQGSEFGSTIELTRTTASNIRPPSGT